MYYISERVNGIVSVTDTTDGVTIQTTESELKLHIGKTGDRVYGYKQIRKKDGSAGDYWYTLMLGLPCKEVCSTIENQLHHRFAKGMSESLYLAATADTLAMMKIGDKFRVVIRGTVVSQIIKKQHDYVEYRRSTVSGITTSVLDIDQMAFNLALDIRNFLLNNVEKYGGKYERKDVRLVPFK